MDSKQKLFAFKVASKRQEATGNNTQEKWTARNGVAAAGCTAFRFPGNVRGPHPYYGADRGIYC